MYHPEKRDAPEASDPLHRISYLRPGIEDFNGKGDISHSPIWFEVATLQFTPLHLEFEAFLHERFGLTRDDTCRWVGKSCPVYSFRAVVLVADMVIAGLSQLAQSCHLGGSIELGALKKIWRKRGSFCP